MIDVDIVDEDTKKNTEEKVFDRQQNSLATK
jgi:hypothetical protein